jgi:energy-coupling factor transporter ATP-binding protein EcfA2
VREKGKVELTIDSKIIKGKSILKEIGFIFQNPESSFLF